MPVAVLPIEKPVFRPEDGFVLKRIVAPDIHYQNYGGDEDDYVDYENPSLIFTNGDHKASPSLRLPPFLPHLRCPCRSRGWCG